MRNLEHSSLLTRILGFVVHTLLCHTTVFRPCHLRAYNLWGTRCTAQLLLGNKQVQNLRAFQHQTFISCSCRSCYMRITDDTMTLGLLHMSSSCVVIFTTEGRNPSGWAKPHNCFWSFAFAVALIMFAHISLKQVAWLSLSIYFIGKEQKGVTKNTTYHEQVCGHNEQAKRPATHRRSHLVADGLRIIYSPIWIILSL